MSYKSALFILRPAILVKWVLESFRADLTDSCMAISEEIIPTTACWAL